MPNILPNNPPHAPPSTPADDQTDSPVTPFTGPSPLSHVLDSTDLTLEHDREKSPSQPSSRPHGSKKKKLRNLQEWSSVRLTLENRGSVARDHLATERTFLAYVRTSLAVSTAGVAMVQLFTLTKAAGMSDPAQEIRAFARPLGATLILCGLLVLLTGMWRFFDIQRTLIRGSFPLARVRIITITLILSALTTIIFGVLVGGRAKAAMSS